MDRDLQEAHQTEIQSLPRAPIFKRQENSKCNRKENKSQHALSPSQKMIQEFKKKELLKYGSPKIILETRKSNPVEWQVLYTTQVTQKAKKYHDGFMRLVICGTHGGQVMLFSQSRKLLVSRFLKKDEVIRSGESIAFDGYLVDIGEQEHFKPDFSAKQNSCTDIERRGMMHRQDFLDTHIRAGNREWQVLYTKQLTQKAKKYNDGFLQLEICGSQGRQVVLCDSSKTPIERKFLKKDEVIRPGQLVYFDCHLVDVGEPEDYHQSPVNLKKQKNGDNIERQQIRHGQNSCVKANLSVAKEKRQITPSSGKDTGLNSLFLGVDKIESNRIVSLTKPLRDANQILSILQNPMDQQIDVAGGQPARTMGAPNDGSCENVSDRKSTENMKSPNIMFSKEASNLGSIQFTENIELSHQSDMEAQMHSSEADFGFGISAFDADPNYSSTNEEHGNVDEFSCAREVGDECPSFDLGF